LSLLSRLSSGELLDQAAVIHVLGLDEIDEDSLHARGHRLLGQLSRVPVPSANRLVDHFGSLQALLGATTSELMAVDGIGEQRARTVREGLASLSEQAFTDDVV
ncbi:MAG: DNA integrity scanning protein DisA, partial [Propionibacterium sp.]|nr:DNA integrity scanning protein DisA [Propionibacterium sp.]